MANTVHGPFSAISITNGVTPINKTWGDNAQTQASVALNGFNADLVTAGFVLSGITCTKDSTNANQLDIASGRAYVVMSDGTVGLIVVGADTTHTTSTPSTTYYLFLKNDGTWQWSTASTGPANSLAICQATTDGSGNISAVTDKRVMSPGALFAGADTLRVPGVVARVVAQHVTSTATQIIISYDVPATGVYRFSGYVNFGNTSNQMLDFEVDWWDGTDGVGQAHTLFDGTQRWNGSNTITHGVHYGFDSYTVYAQTGHTILVFYTDPGGSPNDYVTAIIERV